MIEFEGREYIVDDATTNAYNLLNYINEYMKSNGIKNRKGEIVQFKINLGSPIWLIIFGVGYIATVIQKLIYAVAQAFSINSCADQQVLNLAQVARVTRKTGSYSTMVMRVSASSEDCTITTADTVTVTYNDIEYVFRPAIEYVIPKYNTDSVLLFADKVGPVYITSGSIKEFDEPIKNMLSCTNLGSEPGTGAESIAALRTRIQQNETVVPVNSVINALNGLTGVGKANMYFNTSNNETVTVAGHAVPPRSTILFVQGTSREIASTYYKYMTAPTVTEGAIVQDFIAVNGQSFPVGYFPPETIQLYVKLYLSKNLPDDEIQSLRSAVASLSNTLPMGSDYTQAYILDSLSDNELFGSIIGCELSSDGSTFSNSVALGYNNIGVIQNSETYIVIEAPEE